MTKKRGPGKPFQPGNNFGRGRPAGSRNKSTLRLRALIEDQGEAIVRTAIDLAKSGDATALKLCLERLVPPSKERPIALKLPADITTAEGTLAALASIVAALARGEITPGETLAAARVLDSCRQAVETQELDRRLTALEKGATDEDAPPECSGGRADPADPCAGDLNGVEGDSMTEARGERKLTEPRELRNE